MQLSTLMDILEQEIGASSSARSQLTAMLAERALKDAAQKPTQSAPKPRKHSARAR